MRSGEHDDSVSYDAAAADAARVPQPAPAEGFSDRRYADVEVVGS